MWPRTLFLSCLLGSCAVQDRSAEQRASLASDYAAFWRFDEGKGAVASDSSSHDVYGTLSPSGVSWTAGQIGSAISFDGVTGGIDLVRPSLNDVPNWTWQGWVYPISDGGIVYGEGAPGLTWGLLISADGTVTVQAYNSAASGDNWVRALSPSGTVVLNQWNLLTVTFENGGVNAGIVKFYIDKSYVAEAPGQVESSAGSINAGFGYNVGSKGGQVSLYWAGKLDEVVLFLRTLSPAEICDTGQLSGSKCLPTPGCCTAQGNVCLGTSQDCKASGPCAVVSCSSPTDTCEEFAALDGTPCDATNCSASASCVSGVCQCAAADGGALDAHPDRDQGTGVMTQGSCALVGSIGSKSTSAHAPVWPLILVGLWWARQALVARRPYG